MEPAPTSRRPSKSKSAERILRLAAVVVAVSVSSPAQAEWEPLFDGESLDGWKRLGGKATYRIESGSIVGESQSGTPNTFLATERSYGDFVLQLEYLVDPQLNSGIQIRSASTPEYRRGQVHGYQVEIDPSPRAWSAGIYDEARRGWLFALETNPRAQKAFKQNDWNQVTIACVGPTIRTWLNGVPTSYLVDDMSLSGFIALQVHSVSRENSGRTISWRNIRIATSDIETIITSLDESFPHVVNLIPNRLDQREAELGWRLLHDGDELDDWRPTKRNAWQMEDGLLVSRAGKAGNHLLSRSTFESFELQFEFRATRDAAGGVDWGVSEGEKPTRLGFHIADDASPAARSADDANGVADLSGQLKATKPARFVNPAGRFNHARILVDHDGRVEHWLNHMRVLEFELGAEELRDALGLADSGGGPPEGHLRLRHDGDEIAYRSLKVREITPD